MSFIASFLPDQILGFESDVIINDTSTGSDVLITSRKIYLRKADGTFLVPTGTTTDYIVWATGTSTKTLDVLASDKSLYIIVEWLNVSGNILYTSSGLYGFTLYNETFDYQTTQILAANPLLINDNNFWNNKSSVRTYIDGGNQAIALASDQKSAQLCYDEATKLRLSSQYYFNANA